LSSGTYTVEVRGMGGGSANDTSIRYYPMNGDVSAIQSTSLTVEPPIGYINGTVTSGGSPIAGVVISTTGASTTTAADGTYSLSVVAGTYDVTASKAPVYADSTATGVAVISEATTTQDFVLTLNPTGSITGTVTMG
ncbi:MAG: carboxypeptidase regulatory-like domain-containing protein, partial [Methanosarcinales archaeon]|nr:carboxypeptidase regulatory-like domain-containing protein [Methanosarcinales archaeon]